MDDSADSLQYGADTKAQTLRLTNGHNKNWQGNLHYQFPATELLTLNGELGHEKVSMNLKRIDHTKFELISRGFHWIQEYPYFR